MAHLLRSLLLLVPVFLSSAAVAEGTDSRHTAPNPASRIRNASSLKPTPDGGWVSTGFSTLQLLPPGATQWRKLHRIEGDNLYRVAIHDSGAILAAWERDPSIHVFVPKSKEHRTIPKPAAPPPVFHFHVEHLEFLENGREAMVWMHGQRPFQDGPYRNHHPVGAMYRVSLDGSKPPELLYAVDAAKDLYISATLGVFVMPKRLGQPCEHRTCDPVDQIFAYEISDRGAVSKRTVLSSTERYLSNARIIWGSNEDHLMLELHHQGQERGLYYWKRSEPKGAYRPFPKENDSSERFHLLKNGDLVELVKSSDYMNLEVRRHSRSGSTQTTLLIGSTDRIDYDKTVHGIGERGSGSLWLHWGNHLLLLPAKGEPKGYHIEPLLTRRAEWAGADLYRPNPETLWIGIEVGSRRDFERLLLDDLEKKAKPWPARQTP